MTIPPITRRQTNFMASQFEIRHRRGNADPRCPLRRRGVPKRVLRPPAGLGGRRANQPRTIYYVMVPERREPATFAALYAPNGDELRYKMFAREQAARQLDEEWMGWLRKQAGLERRLGSARRGQGQGVVDEDA